MNKNLSFALLCFIGILSYTSLATAQTVDETPTVLWEFSSGAEGQTATYSGSTGDYFKTDHVSLGSNLSYDGTNTTGEVTYTLFNPTTQSDLGDENAISFNIWPVLGLEFTPTYVSFNMMRFGTDGGEVAVVWTDSDGNSTTVTSGIKPIRNNESSIDSAASSVSLDLSSLGIEASGEECTLEIYIYSLGDTKQAGFANILVEGTLSGTVVHIPSYKVETSVTPVQAGSITSYPVGTYLDSNTVVTLTANKNFGYAFSHWEDGEGSTVASDNPYSFTLLDSVELVAVYETLNTYSLDVLVDGGANDYMIDISPEGTTVGDDLMYEEGTNVLLTASENQVLSFSNWSDGTTSGTLNIQMNSDQTVTASYSAIDYIVGWDFYISGNSGRTADFYSKDENETSALVVRNEAGDNASWLDKSTEYTSGEEYWGKPAAVNWNPIADNYYFQINFNASDFTDIVVSADLLYNYNAYSVYNCEYSLDNSTWTSLGTYTLTTNKVWYNETFTLPSAADHATAVYVRWIPDYTSSKVGTTSDNDGIAITEIYITANEEIADDGTAPVLSSSIPANDATGASATGKIILNFDEKVQITSGTTASLGGTELEPSVTGKTIMFPYKGLDYNKQYTFTLAGNTVSDLAGNTLTDAIEISFTTLDRPTVDKKLFDFIVGEDGNISEAFDAAADASSSGERFYIFLPDGEYNLGIYGEELIGQMYNMSTANVSIIGQSSDSSIIYNESASESIATTATMHLTSSATSIYMQDLSLLNKMDYRTGTLLGRAVALWNQGDKNIFKNVNLLSNQDTYYTGGDRAYHETCEIHGTVDFICGGGDNFFNECLIYLEERESGDVITAAATSTDWGYVFSSCTIDGYDGSNGDYRLGRPWSNEPKVVYINTTMNVIPTAEAWGDPMNVVPSVFAEYNSLTSSGVEVNLTNRRTSYTKDDVTVTLDPVLTAEEAAEYTVYNVLSGSDSWEPQLSTEQSPIPVVSANDDTTKIVWDNSEYVLCWGIFLDDIFVEFTTDTTYSIPAEVDAGIYTVRAANAMGGLSEESNSLYYNIETHLLNITVTDGSAGIESAKITIDGDTYTTDASGEVSITLLTGTYNYTITANGYYDNSSTVTISNADVNITVALVTDAIDNSLANEIKAYPNPASTSLIVEGLPVNTEITIFNIQGKMIRHTITGFNQTTIDVSNLPSGMYCIKTTYGTIPFMVE